MTTATAAPPTLSPADLPNAKIDPTALDSAIARASDCLLSRQDPSGYWCAELQGDSILQSEYILLKFILGQESDPDLILIANELRHLQNPDGGWPLYPGGKPDISGTVKGYFCLKLMGDSPDAPHMVRCRELIHALGGAEKCNTFTRFYFACLGQVSFEACPSIPPEIVFLPKWFYFNLYNVSAWTRTMILPLGLVTTLKPLGKLTPAQGIAELYLDPAAANRLGPPLSGLPRNWAEIFLRLDQFLKFYGRHPIGWLRRKSIKAAEKWILDHLDGSEGLGAIFPPMVYLLIVYQLLGYPEDHPRVKKSHQELRDFYIREGDRIRLQPCFSPVWDTGIALHALAEAGLDPESSHAKRATEWLLKKEVRVASDWAKNARPVEPSGWFFEFENRHYPDTDDTAMAINSLKRIGGPTAADACARGVKWLFAMQNDDGGWAAFDKTTDRPLLEKIPFADHNAMQDPSCPDITGRILEALGRNGLTIAKPEIQHAVDSMRIKQDPCGAWWGRWGVNYIYGTWQCLMGMNRVGVDMRSDYIQRAGAWLKSVQKPDGSFGETCESYEDASLKGIGESTPSQTAWGAMGMMAVYGAKDPDVERAINWLIRHQRPDGDWDETLFTGTGFPKVFYLRYHLYRLYFPLTALARFRNLRSSTN